MTLEKRESWLPEKELGTQQLDPHELSPSSVLWEESSQSRVRHERHSWVSHLRRSDGGTHCCAEQREMKDSNFTKRECNNCGGECAECAKSGTGLRTWPRTASPSLPSTHVQYKNFADFFCCEGSRALCVCISLRLAVFRNHYVSHGLVLVLSVHIKRRNGAKRETSLSAGEHGQLVSYIC